jgi:alkanesulfonate monooxygenase SsuD/methylene tetrahydromethanopterin reductase-like flavin-dependent oxidoreductase (luciferase family)
MREKSLHLAGREGDGTILTAMSSPAYVEWALGHIRTGMTEAGRGRHRVVVYLDVKVNRDDQAARAAMRQALVERWPWADIQLAALGIAPDADRFFQERDRRQAARDMPDEWVDAFSAAGTPEQVTGVVQRLIDAGAGSVVFQPLNGDPACLDEYIRYRMPHNFKSMNTG